MKEDTMVVFREVQRFRQLWIWILPISAFLFYAMLEQVILGNPLGDHPAPDILWVVFALFIGLGLPLMFFLAKLTTEVRTDAICFQFFPFHLSFTRIPFSTLKGHQTITYGPINEFGGWGIRQSHRRKAYTVSGNRGVELKLPDGSRLLFGSQQPEKFAEAIDWAQRQRPSPSNC